MLKSIYRRGRSLFRRLRGEKNRVAPIPIDPRISRYQKTGEMASRLGINGVYFVLSFDCDTPEDIPAALEIQQWLGTRGIKATYCVPGAELLKGKETYQKIYSMGAQFMNHGARSHAYWSNGRYWPMTFYDQLTSDEVKEDIRLGDQIVRGVIGCPPRGFRAPHFGSYQLPEQRSVMYGALKQLGYIFSSSTLPGFAFDAGPVSKIDETIYEIPLTGSWATPEVILDSWNYIISPFQPTITDEYFELFQETVQQIVKLNSPFVLNYYVDPAHVYRSESFYKALSLILDCRIPTLFFPELLELVSVVR
jgi:peptidoglycan/xylan/chitin deacetylase (PgdA/CDA1 family)